jgi:hypothetical protein
MGQPWLLAVQSIYSLALGLSLGGSLRIQWAGCCHCLKPVVTLPPAQNLSCHKAVVSPRPKLCPPF